MLRFPNFHMLFDLALTKFFKSKLFSCLPKVDHVIKSSKEPIEQQQRVHSFRNILFVLSNLLLKLTDTFASKSFLGVCLNDWLHVKVKVGCFI